MSGYFAADGKAWSVGHAVKLWLMIGRCDGRVGLIAAKLVGLKDLPHLRLYSGQTGEDKHRDQDRDDTKTLHHFCPSVAIELCASNSASSLKDDPPGITDCREN